MMRQPFTTYCPWAVLVACALLSACHEPDQPAMQSKAPPAPVQSSASHTASQIHDSTDGVATPTAISQAELTRILVPAEACNIESFDGGRYAAAASITQGATFKIAGWVVDRKAGNVPGNAELRIQAEGKPDAWAVALHPSGARPDVMAVQGGSKGLLDSGFTSAVSSGPLAPGRYHLFIQYQTQDGLMSCDNGRQLEVTP